MNIQNNCVLKAELENTELISKKTNLPFPGKTNGTADSFFAVISLILFGFFESVSSNQSS